MRFQGTTRSDRGHFPGVFALVNGLAREGGLTEEQERFRRANNDWYDANFTNPSDLDPTVYDPHLNAGVVAWFKVTAIELIKRADGYLEILAAHGVTCERAESSELASSRAAVRQLRRALRAGNETGLPGVARAALQVVGSLHTG